MLWILAWIGTAVAGGVVGVGLAFSAISESGLGVIFLAVVGFVVGFMLAGFVAFPIVLTVAVLNWAFWLKRLAVPMAAVSGAATGILCAGVVNRGLDPYVFSGLAGIMGAAGAGLAGALYTLRRNRRPAFDTEQEPWRYSLKGLFIRFTVVTLLVAGWTWAAKAYIAARI